MLKNICRRYKGKQVYSRKFSRKELSKKGFSSLLYWRNQGSLGQEIAREK